MEVGNKVNRRSFLRKSAGAVAATATGAFFHIDHAAASDEFVVNMQLGWLVSNGIIGEIAADELGYFAASGMRLNVVPGGPNIDGIASIASGRSNLGSISSSPSLMMARAAGIPIKCVAAGLQRHPFTYFSMSNNPVVKPQDLIGKRIATQGLARILLQALLAKNNISEDDIEIQVMGADMTALKSGRVDVVTGWKTNVNALSILGDKRVDMTLWDAGIQLYANPYYVTDETLTNHRDKVETIVRIIAKGWAWVHDNPEQAVDFLVKRYPQLDRESELESVMLINELAFNEATARNGWGTMNKENWQAQIDVYHSLGQFEDRAPTLKELVDFSILEATAADRPTYG